MSRVTLKNVKKSFGKVDVIKGIDLDLDSNQFTVFVGPSGCGKSTLLRLVAGLEEVTEGEIYIDDQSVTHVVPSKRRVAMVFQSYALYPHMTVYENMSFALRRTKYPKEEIHRRVMDAAETLQVTHLLERKPKELSGGQRQRVAIGRAIIRDPKVFLFDEPLSNLDATLRVQMRMRIAKLKEKLHTTMIYVTHDQVEAMTLADRIVVLNAGRVEQVGSPLDLYHHPVNKFVAGFIGSPKMNFLPVTLEDIQEEKITLRLSKDKQLTMPIQPAPDLAERLSEAGVELGVRPEHFFLTTPDQALFQGVIQMIEHLGGEIYAYVEIESGPTLLMRVFGDVVLKEGQTVSIGCHAKDCHLFRVDTGLSFERLGAKEKTNG